MFLYVSQCGPKCFWVLCISSGLRLGCRFVTPLGYEVAMFILRQDKAVKLLSVERECKEQRHKRGNDKETYKPWSL
jgi:hypothetical protein